MEKSPYSLPTPQARLAIETRRQALLTAGTAKEPPYPDDEPFDLEPVEHKEKKGRKKPGA